MPYEFYNDVHMIPYYIIIFSAAIITLFIGIVFHELGHWLWFKLKKKRNITIRWTKKDGILAGYPEDYADLNEKEYVRVNLWGILMGMLPIIALGYFAEPLLYLVIVGYLFGCKDDIKNITSRIKFEEQWD